MSGSTNSFLAEGNRFLRELVGQQGAAYRAYGEVLQRFGDSEMDLSELVKASGDIYYKETGRLASNLLRASAGICSWVLSVAGAKPLQAPPEPREHAAPTGKRTQRGRG